MRKLLENGGARFHPVGPTSIPRHFGDPAAEYEAAVTGVALLDLSHRTRLRVEGRAPGQMLQGLVTSRVPEQERPVEPGVRGGRSHLSAVLTPKGRLVTDLRLLRLDGAPGDATHGDPSGSAAGTSAAPGSQSNGGGPGGGGSTAGSGTPGRGGPGPAGGEAAGSTPAGGIPGPALTPGKGGGDETYLMDLPPEGVTPAMEHFGRFLPPRFARVTDVTEETGMLSVLGPDAASTLALHALGLRVDQEVLEGLEEGEYRAVDTGSGSWLRVIRAGELATPSWDLLADRQTIRGLWQALSGAGARPVGHGVRETLRVEAGRPAFGVDMDETTIPVEAGIAERVIAHGKGCYTGQEVIVRIRDRGRVNRHLRGLRLADGPSPAPGTELYAPDIRGEKSAGRLTSVVDSPRMGLVALGYVRREVEPGGEVRVGSVDGPAARVASLEEGGWGPG